jgi:hypothetical protein
MNQSFSLRKIFQEHFEELRFDEGFIDEAFAVVSGKTSPAEKSGFAPTGYEYREYKN